MEIGCALVSHALLLIHAFISATLNTLFLYVYALDFIAIYSRNKMWLNSVEKKYLIQQKA